jgi:AbrB family looped-hinge helix DNA binding protein
MAVTVSPDFQVVIPKEIRESMDIKPGMKFEVLSHKGRIELIPVKDIRELRGILKGMGVTIERDEEDRV